MNHILKKMRQDMIKMAYYAGKQGSHIGPALSLTEIFAVLYNRVLNFDLINMTSQNRDRLILSKGHGVMVQYSALVQIGLIPEADIETFKKNGTVLSAHPIANESLGIEFSGGSLGQGLSQAVGVALALKYKKNNYSKVYVIIGDGECNEGSVWEAVMSAVHYKLDNLVVIVDKNNIQYDDFTKNVLDMHSIVAKFSSFGMDVEEVDGHNIEELTKAFNRISSQKPRCIIANTIKGKGVSFMENNPKWHYNVLTDDLYQTAMLEIGGVE